jgi:hypothetical protein
VDGQVPDRLLHYFLVYGLDSVAILAAAVALWRGGSARSSWVWAITATVAVALAARTIHSSQVSDTSWGDFRNVWNAGAYVLDGKDPYRLFGFTYPPNSLPLFRLIALVPLRAAIVVWPAINILIFASLGLVTRRLLVAQDQGRIVVVEPVTSALLAAAVSLSMALQLGIDTGNVASLVAFALLGALWAQPFESTGPVISAACLAIAAIKPQTMLPFMLLFLRRADRLTWVLLTLFLTVITLFWAGSPMDFFNRFYEMASVQALERGPGRILDYSILNPYSYAIIGFDHVFSRIGIDTRTVTMALSTSITLAMGVWVTYLVLRKPEVPRGACCSLVSLYSTVFFMHRLYDMAVLIIPVIWCASRFRSGTGPAKWSHAVALAAIVLALNPAYGEMLVLTRNASHPVVTALFLPSVTYLIIVAFCALSLGTWLELCPVGLISFRGQVPNGFRAGSGGPQAPARPVLPIRNTSRPTALL